MNLKNLQAQVHISTAAIILLNNFTFAFSVFGTLDDLTWKCSKGWGSWGRHGILNIMSVFALKFSLNPVILWKPTTTLALIWRITQKLFAINLGSFTRDKKSHELVWSGNGCSANWCCWRCCTFIKTYCMCSKDQPRRITIEKNKKFGHQLRMLYQIMIDTNLEEHLLRSCRGRRKGGRGCGAIVVIVVVLKCQHVSSTLWALNTRRMRMILSRIVRY